jgi:hypothetical protein
MLKIKNTNGSCYRLAAALFLFEQSVMALSNWCLHSRKKRKSSKIPLARRHRNIPAKEFTFLKFYTNYSAFAKAEPI